MLKYPSVLWSVTRNNRTSYIFGSIHIQDSRVFGKVNQLVPFIQNCDCFAAELDLSRDFSASNISLGKADWSYQKLLTAKKYSRLQRSLLKKFHIQLESVDHINPFDLVLIIQTSFLGQQEFAPLDHTLWNMASDMDKDLHGLETWEEQMDIYYKMAQSEPLSQLFKLLRRSDKIKTGISKLVKLYISQDVYKLYTTTRKELGNNRKWMINHRNQIITERFQKIDSNKSVFASIGTAHLCGKFGVLRRLKHSGYEVRPVII